MRPASGPRLLEARQAWLELEACAFVCLRETRYSAQHALPCGWPRVESAAGRGGLMHDFGDLGRALEMVALLPGVALGG